MEATARWEWLRSKWGMKPPNFYDSQNSNPWRPMSNIISSVTPFLTFPISHFFWVPLQYLILLFRKLYNVALHLLTSWCPKWKLLDIINHVLFIIVTSSLSLMPDWSRLSNGSSSSTESLCKSGEADRF